jgi:uncharacterized protein YkwD
MAGFPTTNPRPWQTAHDVLLAWAAISLCAAGLVFSLHRSSAVAEIVDEGLAARASAAPQLAPQAPVSAAMVVPVATNDVSEGASPSTDFYLPFVPAGQASPEERSLLDATNSARVVMGLAPLVADDDLNQLARIRVRQLAAQGYFGHVDPAGYRMYTELLALTGLRYNWAGENLALDDSPIAESPAHAFAALMQSPDHRENILAADYSMVGIGELTTPDGRHIYAMIFVG